MPCRNSIATACCSPTTTVPTAACSSPPAKWPSPAAAASRSISTASATTPAPAMSMVPRSCPHLLAGRDFENIVRTLFNEELGALIQICREDREKVTPILRACGVPYHFVGTLNEWDEIRVTRNAKRVLREKRVDLQRAWSETSYQMQAMRDNPSCAQQEFDRILDVADPGLTPKLTFDPQEDFTQVYQDISGRPRVAILARAGRQQPLRNGCRL